MSIQPGDHDDRLRRYESVYGGIPLKRWVGKRVADVPAGLIEYAGPRNLRRWRGCVHVRVTYRAALPGIPAYFAASVGGDETSSGLIASAGHLGTLIAYTLQRFDRVVLDVTKEADEANAAEYPDL